MLNAFDFATEFMFLVCVMCHHLGVAATNLGVLSVPGMEKLRFVSSTRKDVSIGRCWCCAWKVDDFVGGFPILIIIIVVLSPSLVLPFDLLGSMLCFYCTQLQDEKAFRGIV
jgi:hypothetical protein